MLLVLVFSGGLGLRLLVVARGAVYPARNPPHGVTSHDTSGWVVRIGGS